MALKGVAWKFGDQISTDLIAPGRYYHLRGNLPEFVKHVLEDADPNFAPAAAKKDKTYIVVGGVNFGKGSSREHAPLLIKMAGAPVVLAKGFARIFYRNCFNNGLPALIVDTSRIQQGDALEVNLETGEVKDLTQKFTLKVDPVPDVMMTILGAGGILKYIEKKGDLVF